MGWEENELDSLHSALYQRSPFKMLVRFGRGGLVSSSAAGGRGKRRGDHPRIAVTLTTSSAQRLSASSEFSLRWVQPHCLPQLVSLFSRIRSFLFRIVFPQP